jgi:uncharacterized protein YhaN
LREAPSPEALDAYEQQLAAQMRSAGSQTSLSARLLDLLDAQEAEPGCTAALSGAEAELGRLERRWEAWRREVAVPADVDVEHAEAWADDVVGLADACAARDSARAELAALEPGIGAWEDETRQVLARVGTRVSRELCGSALAAELTALAARARAEEEQRRRAARLDAELRETEQQLADATAELARARTARTDLISAVGARGDSGLDATVDRLRRWREARNHRDRLQRSVDDALSALGRQVDARHALGTGAVERWSAALRDCQAALDEVTARLEQMAERRRTLEQTLAGARSTAVLADLRLEREQLLAELAAAARAWKLRALAAALLDSALREHVRSDSRELLQRASATLATLTGGRFTHIVRPAGRDGLALIEGAGGTVPVDSQLEPTLRAQTLMSLVLGRAAQLAGRGESVPVVLDDALAALSADEARLAAQEIAGVARTCPVVYLTTAASRDRVLSALPGEVAVLDPDTER